MIHKVSERQRVIFVRALPFWVGSKKQIGQRNFLYFNYIPPLLMKQCFLWDAASQISVEIFTSEDEWRTATIRYHGETDHWRKKRWAWNFGTFSAWSLKHGNSEGNSVSVKLGFALESKRKKLWPTRARAITINRFYTASPNQTQSCSFSTFLKLAYVIAESSNYTFYTRGFLTIAALCPFPGFALGILP